MTTAPKIRRFEPGASSLGLDGFLETCGYRVSKHLRQYRVQKIGARGRWKTMNHEQLMALLDCERMKRGLQPMCVERAA